MIGTSVFSDPVTTGTCSSAGRASALQAGVAGSIPATSTILPSDLKALVKFLSTQSLSFGSNCARMRFLQCDCAHWSRRQNVSGHRPYFVGSTLERFRQHEISSFNEFLFNRDPELPGRGGCLFQFTAGAVNQARLGQEQLSAAKIYWLQELRRVRTRRIVLVSSWLTQEATSSARNLGNSRLPVWPLSALLPMQSVDRENG
jgi:hypothetical protein